MPTSGSQGLPGVVDILLTGPASFSLWTVGTALCLAPDFQDELMIQEWLLCWEQYLLRMRNVICSLMIYTCELVIHVSL